MASVSSFSCFPMQYKTMQPYRQVTQRCPKNVAWYFVNSPHACGIPGIVCWLERQTRDRKVASSNPSRSGGRILFSRVNFVCGFLFGVRSTPMLPQWHIKDPGHSAKSACGRLYLNMHTPLTQRNQSGLTMPLSRQSVGICQETSSHATRQGTLGHMSIVII